MSASTNTRTNLMLVLVSVILLAGSITLGYFLFREDKEEKTYLKVEEVYFFQKDLGDYESSIDIIIMISNTGKADVSKVSVRSFAIETDSNLAQYDASIVLTNVKGKTTVEGRMSIIVPNGDAYRVELLIFKDDRLTIMGYGNIDLTGVGIVSEYQDVSDDSDDSPPYDSAGAPMKSASSAGVCLIVLVIALAIIALIVIVSVYAAKRSGPEEPPAEEDEMKFITLEPPVDEKRDHETDEIRRADPLDMLAEHEEDEKEEKAKGKEKDLEK